MTLRLGEGIAKVDSETGFPKYIERTYVPDENVRDQLRVWGRALQAFEERVVNQLIKIDGLAFCNGRVWKKDESGVRVLLNSIQLENIKDLINVNKSGSGMYELGNRDSGERIIVRDIVNEEGVAEHQVWLPKQPGAAQVLIDSIFCLHFNQPAVDENGENLDSADILKVAELNADMFRISSEGRVLLSVVEIE